MSRFPANRSAGAPPGTMNPQNRSATAPLLTKGNRKPAWKQQPWLIPSLIWGSLAAVVLGMHFYFPPIPAPRTATSYSASADGFKAFYEILEQDAFVYRNDAPLDRLMELVDPDGTLLLILNPPRIPNEAEWNSLYSWVNMGGRLVYAPPPGEVDSLGPFDGEITPDKGPADDRIPPQLNLPLGGRLLWWPEGEVTSTPGGKVLVSQDGSPQAVMVNAGRGSALFVASPWIFSNQLLTYGDNSALAFELIREAAGPGQSLDDVVIAFDESLNTRATPQMMGVLFQPPLRSISVQILLLFMLYGWWNSCRFGPTVVLEETSQREIVEHTSALGRILWRSADCQFVLFQYLRYWLTEHRLQEASGRKRRLSSRLQNDAQKVDQALEAIHQAEMAAMTPRLGHREAARHIRALSVLGQSLQR